MSGAPKWRAYDGNPTKRMITTGTPILGHLHIVIIPMKKIEKSLTTMFMDCFDYLFWENPKWLDIYIYVYVYIWWTILNLKVIMSSRTKTWNDHDNP